MSIQVQLYALNHHIGVLEFEIPVNVMAAAGGLVGAGLPEKQRAALAECIAARQRLLDELRALGPC